MTWESGPTLETDAQGHTVAFGFMISGDDERGYCASTIEPLSPLEVEYGAIHLIFSDNLIDLLTRCKGQKLLRAGIRKAREQAREDLKPTT